MGQRCSHMNAWALSAIIRANDEDLDQILLFYEQETEKNPRLEPYHIEQAKFTFYLEKAEIHPSDREIFEDYFHLLDIRNRRVVSVVDLLISLAPLTTRGVKELFNRCFWIFDRRGNQMIAKHHIIHIVKLLNGCFESVGDKPLAPEIVYDFVNSVYTSAGKIDGEIYYPDFVEFMTLHPIVELFISPQFQGSLAMKLQQQEELERKEKEEAIELERIKHFEQMKGEDN